MKSAIAVPKVVESQTKSSTDKTVSRRSAPGTNMDQAAHNKIVSFLWGIADDVLRDLFKRGKYPDVILPMCVLRRLDAVLEPIGIGVSLTAPPLPHHRTCGSASGGSAG